MYATFHANNAQETVDRLINAPINVPKTMLPAISMLITQFRNRRTGMRRTFQIAEILPDASVNILKQYDAKKDVLKDANASKSILTTLQLYTGMSKKDIDADLKEKQMVLKYLVDKDINTVDGVGRVMAEYYTSKKDLLDVVRRGKLLGDMP